MIIPYFLGNLGMGGGAAPTGPTTLREAFRAKLLESWTGPIYFNSLPQAPRALPALTYYVASRSYGRHLGGVNHFSQATLRVSAWSRTQAEADQIAQQLRSQIDGFQGKLGQVEILHLSLQNETDLPEYPRDGSDKFIYQIVLDFLVNHKV